MIQLVVWSVSFRKWGTNAMLNVQTSKNYGWQDQTVSAGVIMSELIKKVANQQDHTAFQLSLIHI